MAHPPLRPVNLCPRLRLCLHLHLHLLLSLALNLHLRIRLLRQFHLHRLLLLIQVLRLTLSQLLPLILPARPACSSWPWPRWPACRWCSA